MYTYEQLKKDLRSLERTYPCAKLFSVGESVEGRSLYTMRVGEGERKIFFCGAHHGSEWLTAKMLVRFLWEELLPRKIHPSLSVFVLPMVNPDGVEISQKGASRRHRSYRELIRMNKGEDFTHWQANARGVDLNHNYRAGWTECKELERAMGIFGPGPTRFGGEEPESEPESRAVADFTRKERFSSSVSFHSQGEVIYWDSSGKSGGEGLAKRLSVASGYPLDVPEGIAAGGGYKDWVTLAFGTPSFTVEMGQGENPLPEEDLEEIVGHTFPLMWELLSFEAECALTNEGKKSTIYR